MRFKDLSWDSLDVNHLVVECMARSDGRWITVAYLEYEEPVENYAKVRDAFDMLKDAFSDWEVSLRVEDGALKIIALP